MSAMDDLPAYSSQFLPEVIRALAATGPISHITPEWAWGGSTGRGVRVAVVDSGIEADHPAVGGMVRQGVIVEYDEAAEEHYRVDPDPEPRDLSGHGTACAGIIHSLAPEAELYSVRVLGRDMRGRAIQFAGGVDWTLQNGMQVANLSLSTARQEYYALFHEIADDAYFKNVVLVSAVNNVPAPSYPSLYAAVISVAAHTGRDPLTYYYNPAPPVEFGAPGIDVRVAWKDHQYLTSTGNSFAAPHITGIVALIRAKHPELTPFQIKTVLWACAANVCHDEG
ncbi:MAG TPA: S8 family serine peptidase [Moraxellaceae bacterium]|nr:S8 family serine peptidase [Moraxellaceae bacterium]